jgi:ParB family transcriptional regulator, chromosome partitioning protein
VRTDSIKPNPENPRLVFYESELLSLQESIRDQGILVPLTVYSGGKGYVILDGERRWKCAKRLGLDTVPVIIQPKPDRLQNIMMMFAIHKARRDWPPLSTALKLQQLEEILTVRSGKAPNDRVLAENASIAVGEVRRLKKILRLPENLMDVLRYEQQKDLVEQRLTVDHILEATDGARALEKQGVISKPEEKRLRDAIVDKFRLGKLGSTTEPRKLTKIARAVRKERVDSATARRVALKLIKDPDYTVDSAYADSAADADLLLSVQQVVVRLVNQLETYGSDGRSLDPSLKRILGDLRRRLDRLGV